MGFWDKVTGKDNKMCAECKKEGVELDVTKKIDGVMYKFCSKDCSRKFRIKMKKKGKGAQEQSSGGGLWW